MLWGCWGEGTRGIGVLVVLGDSGGALGGTGGIGSLGVLVYTVNIGGTRGTWELVMTLELLLLLRPQIKTSGSLELLEPQLESL